MALINKLNNLGDSIRAATGTTDLLTLEDMASGVDAIAEERDELENQLNNLPLEELEITANGEYLPSEGKVGFSKVDVDVKADISEALPPEAFIITGDCSYRFAYDGWSWFIREFGDKVKTENITGYCQFMFYQSKQIEEIPFGINAALSKEMDCISIFSGCAELKSIPKLVIKPKAFNDTFKDCKKLVEVKEEDVAGIDWSYIDNQTNQYNGNRSGTFNTCWGLRRFPMSFLKHGNPVAVNSYGIYYNLFNYCYSLDEVRGLPVIHTNAKWTSNAFNNTFIYCGRLKSLTFETNEDGSPIVVNNWSKQVIDLSQSTGYCPYPERIYNYSDIDIKKSVYDSATYEALKNDPDWYTSTADYSRYNKASAVETINSLPDLSGGAGSNTIKFRGAAGKYTDGGAINTMTEEEIAVATAKGWTVSFA